MKEKAKDKRKQTFQLKLDLKKTKNVIILGIGFGLLAWLLDAIIDYFIFYDGVETFMEIFITELPALEIYFRVMILVCFILFGFIISTHIKKRNKTEQELSESEQRFRTIIEQASDALFIQDIEGNIIEVNNLALKILGYSRSELLSMSFHDLESHFADANLRDNILTQLLNGEIATIESKLKLKNGNFCPVEINLSLIKLNNKDFILGFARDITNRKQTEKELKRNQELFKLFMSHSPIHSYIKEVTPTSSRVIIASENYIDMIGFTGSEMAGKTMEDLFPAEFAKKITTDDWEVVSKGTVLKVDEDLNDRNYTTIKFPISLGEKKILAGYTIDITERKLAEKILLKSNKAINGSSDIIFMTDIEGTITFINPKFTEIYGYTAEEVVGKTTPRILKSEMITKEKYEQFWNTITSKNSISATEYINKSKDGSLINVEGSADPIIDDNGDLIGFIGIQRDIRDRKLAEDELKKHREHLEELVMERTAELENKNKELERFNDLFIGREFRIKELRDKVKELEKQIEEK